MLTRRPRCGSVSEEEAELSDGSSMLTQGSSVVFQGSPLKALLARKGSAPAASSANLVEVTAVSLTCPWLLSILLP